jgi:hypothetical protein
MSTEINTAFVRQYGNDMKMLLQQADSKLRGRFSEIQVEGEMVSTEQIGVVDMVARTTQHADTPLVTTPHRRRWMAVEDYEIADLVDTFDQVRLKVDPAGKYMQAQKSAMGRKIDQVLITAMAAASITGKAGTATTALPATSIIQTTGGDSANSGVVTASNLTLGKLRRAAFIMDDNSVPDSGRVFIGGASQKQNLLRSTKVNSSDYAQIKALVNGEVNSFLGFDFIWFGNAVTTMLPVASNIRDCFACHRDGMELGIGQIVTDIGQRRDKSMSWQVYAALTVGATRLEEARVIKVQCDETDTAVPE